VGFSKRFMSADGGQFRTQDYLGLRIESFAKQIYVVFLQNKTNIISCSLTLI
jgi:hypothetical protein